jgi:ATP-dependent exoDNAse (exonuclease V) alpha subunit
MACSANQRLAYVAISRGRYDAQQDAEKRILHGKW